MNKEKEEGATGLPRIMKPIKAAKDFGEDTPPVDPRAQGAWEEKVAPGIMEGVISRIQEASIAGKVVKIEQDLVSRDLHESLSKAKKSVLSKRESNVITDGEKRTLEMPEIMIITIHVKAKK